MPAKFLLVVFIVFQITACTSVDSNRTNVSDVDTAKAKSKAEKSAEKVIGTCDITEIKDDALAINNDQFIASSLEKELTSKYVDRAFSDIKKMIKLSKNQYTEGLFDTTVCYKVDCDSVAYLSTKGNCFPLFLNIQSTRMAFDHGNIKTGITKAVLQKRFHLKGSMPDVIKITGTENANELIFIFKDDKLKLHILEGLRC